MPGKKTNKAIEQIKTVETSENLPKNKEVEISLTTLETKIEVWSLKNDIESDATKETLSENPEQETMLSVVRDLLQKYQSLRKWIKSSELNLQTKLQLTHRLDENIKNLKNIRKDLWWDDESLREKDKEIKIKENAHIYSNLTTYKARIWELIYFYEYYEQIRQIVVLWWRSSDIHAIIDSIQDAKKSRYYENQDNKYQQKMNDVLRNPAKISQQNKDLERYEEYLENVINGK